MKTRCLTFCILFFFLVGGTVLSPHATAQGTVAATGSLSVTFVGLRSTKGVLRITLFDASSDGKGFPGDTKMAKESAVVELARSVAPGAKETTVVFPNLAPGTYAIAAFHDENNNNKMDTHWYGKPKEGSAASNNPRPKLRAPRWSESKFELPVTGKAVTISLWYP